jgi:hypothetical protein
MRVGLVAEPHLRKLLERPPARFLLGETEDAPQGQRDVAEGGLVREEVELLEDEADARPCSVQVGADVGQVDAVEEDATRTGGMGRRSRP